MTMVKYGAGITEIEGRFGGQYFRRDQCINHIQRMPRHVNQRRESPQQKAFGRAKIAWSEHDWTREELDLWWVWCYNHPKKNKKNETVYFHPFIAFLHINIKRILAGQDIVITP